MIIMLLIGLVVVEVVLIVFRNWFKFKESCNYQVKMFCLDVFCGFRHRIWWDRPLVSDGDVIAVWWLGTESDDSGDDENGSGDDESDSVDDGNASGDDGNDSGDDGNDSGDDGNASGDDGNDSGDDGNASGDDESDSGDDENDSGDDGSDQIRGETPMYLTMSCHSFRSWAGLAHSSRTFSWAVIVNISYPLSDKK